MNTTPRLTNCLKETIFDEGVFDQLLELLELNTENKSLRAMFTIKFIPIVLKPFLSCLICISKSAMNTAPYQRSIYRFTNSHSSEKMRTTEPEKIR